MASVQVKPTSNWLEVAIKRRRELLMYGFAGIATIGATLGAVAFFLVKQHRKNKVYSRTAEIACLLRALSRKEAEPRYRVRDHLAQYFLPWHYRLLLSIAPWYIKNRAMKTVPAGLSWLIARTHIYDHIVESSLVNERDITQVVILGAGFDTRFSRLHFPSDREIRLIEIDAPETQRYKQSILASLPDEVTGKNIVGRPQISYVPVNFETDTIEAALMRSTAYNPAAKTLFLWEAVTPYLTSTAVDSVIQFVRDFSGAGSTLAFDVRYLEAIKGTKRYNMSALTSTVGNLREPFKFGVPEGTSRQWALSKGLDVHAIFTPNEFAEYLTSDSSYNLEIPDIMDIIVAKTPIPSEKDS